MPYLHALENKLPGSDNSSSTGAIVGVFPANASILLVQTDNVGHLQWVSLVVVQDCAQVLDSPKTITYTTVSLSCSTEVYTLHLQPSLRSLAMIPAPASPKSNADFLWKGCRGSAYGMFMSDSDKR
jgi:hypothetical protein